ncbi:hypothetical protein CHCC15337_0326 [Bacillus paralicheniformis]|nr:hypothetical protein LI7559_18335 [Bacillus licheniformis LMG 7559]TWJ62193.1 hypothetical protein CHCC5021_1660 [Bacillus paralicheniformis]TWL09563.1 hypothetical protein CHCC19468_1774 [Bacillus paralicheniformis]TWL19193.1 hypothetical protein CHCC19467_3890 [Bacillus paralicheniformis]TWL42963.1 hypothetical protein CHCC15337_0326 [Bacillus paralicheniformis]
MFKIFRKNLIVFEEDGKALFKYNRIVPLLLQSQDEGRPNEKA